MVVKGVEEIVEKKQLTIGNLRSVFADVSPLRGLE